MQKDTVHKFVKKFMGKQKTMSERSYLYNVGDVVNNLLITEQCIEKEKNRWSQKAYKYTCLKCGYDCGEYYKNGIHHEEHTISESNLKNGSGCAICSRNGFVAPNINSIHILRPDIEVFLKHKDDAIKYSPRSGHKLECICPDCGKEYIRSCAKISDYGVPCICGDGFSYPEKFVFDVLQQLEINFKPQYYLNDSMFRYDFYLIDYNVILEVNGIQHYKQKWERDEVENDKNKKDFAFSCGFTDNNYIILDCRESSLDFIKTSLLNSKLNEIFNFDNINFVKSAEFATSNLAKTASELWNNGNSVKDISENLKLHKHTIIAYLKQGNDNGWCSYAVGDGAKRYHKNKQNHQGDQV